MAEKYCGHSRFLNTVLIGMAYQRGWIPLSRENILKGMKDTVAAWDLETNRLAFELGRQLVLDRGLLIAPEKKLSLEEELARIEGWMAKDPGGKRLAGAFGSLMQKARAELKLSEEDLTGLAYRLEDVLQYGGPAYAEEYLDYVLRAWRRDSSGEGFRATLALIHNLHRVMVLKDEVHVSHLLTCARKIERDREYFNIDPSRGDSLSYRHFTTPQFTLFGRDFRIKITTRQWQLRIMRRMKFLRRLLPGWHAVEQEFIGWYTGRVVEPFIGRQGERPSYRAWVEALNAPELAKGYREVREPGMEAAKRGVELLLGRGEELELEKDGSGTRRLPFQWRNAGKPGLRLGGREKKKELIPK